MNLARVASFASAIGLRVRSASTTSAGTFDILSANLAMRGGTITATVRHADDVEHHFLLDGVNVGVAAEARIAVEIGVEHTGELTMFAYMLGMNPTCAFGFSSTARTVVSLPSKVQAGRSELGFSRHNETPF